MGFHPETVLYLSFWRELSLAICSGQAGQVVDLRWDMFNVVSKYLNEEKVRDSLLSTQLPLKQGGKEAYSQAEFEA
jgi:hypothetical protein